MKSYPLLSLATHSHYFCGCLEIRHEDVECHGRGNAEGVAASSTTRSGFVGTKIASKAMTHEEMRVSQIIVIATWKKSVTTLITGIINYLMREKDQKILYILVAQ